jgi:hypothetical protein
MDDYYTNGRRRVFDFLIGFFGPGLIGYVLYALYMLLLSPSYPSYASNQFQVWAFIVAAILYLIVMIVPFKLGRRYIAVGAIAAVVVPLLIFGACLLVLAGLSLTNSLQ